MKKIREILGTATFRQSTTTTISTIINGGLGAIFYFLLARFLGSTDYGIFTIATTSIAMLAGIVDLGFDQGIVKFVPRYKDDVQKQNGIVKLALKIKLLSGILTFVLIWIFSNFLSTEVLKQPVLINILPFVGIGVLVQLLFSFSTSLSQALERFFLWGGLFISTNFLRLILIIVLFFVGELSAFSSVIIYIGMPLVGFIFSLLFLDKKFLFAKNELSYFKELFGFNIWVSAFIIVATISSRLDIYFTTRFLDLAAVGIYGLAVQATSIMPQITGAIGVVTSPKFASFTKDSQNKIYILKASLFTSGIALIFSIVLIPLSFVFFRLVGAEFESAFVPFVILLLSMVILLVNAPVRDSIIYYFGKPQFFFWIGLGHLVLVSILSVFLIPKYNIIGSSLVVLFGQIFIAIASIWYYFNIQKHKKNILV